MSDLDHYAYDLPTELIAQRPPPVRSDARLLIVDRAAQSLEHRHVRDLPELLRPEDCLVLNDTRVAPARLVGRRSLTGGRWEGLFLKPEADGHWRLLGKSRGKIAPGESIALVDNQGQDDVRLWLLEKFPGGVWLGRPDSAEDPWQVLDRVGRVPLPRYIRRTAPEPGDQGRYQTVYAARPGAVAAPTAGLHFTPELLTELERRGVQLCRLTLHVGLDTFRPIAATTLAAHRMHREWGEISAETAQRILAAHQRGGRIVAVGTTSVRVLETAAAAGELRAWSGETDLFIRPPYQFRAVDALLTNFHLPRTTLLVLVRTFGGDELVMRAYAEAIRERYRFYSFGDAMLIV